MHRGIRDPLLVPKRPIFKEFWDFPWPKTAQIWEGTSRLGATAPGRHR